MDLHFGGCCEEDDDLALGIFLINRLRVNFVRLPSKSNNFQLEMVPPKSIV